MHGMVEVTLVRGGEESLDDPASDVVVRRRVSFTSSEFPIRRNMPGYSLLGGRICYTSMKLVAARFVCLWRVLLQ